jgi:hypothetical protein
VTSVFERPRAVREVGPPKPRIVADPWFAVRHPTIAGVVTFYRDHDDADARVLALVARFGERNVNGKMLPRVEIADGLPR